MVDATDSLTAAFNASRKLGWSFERSWITAQLFVPGVKKVEIVSPSTAVITAFNQAVALGSVTPNFRGREA